MYDFLPVPIHSNQMVSLDIVSLFTKVPTDETLAVVWDNGCSSKFHEGSRQTQQTPEEGHTKELISRNVMEIKIKMKTIV